MSRSRRVKLRKLVRERCLRYIACPLSFSEGGVGISRVNCIQQQLQFNLVPQGNAMPANQWEIGFYFSGFIHCVSPEERKFKSALLIKPKRTEVIVGCSQKDTLTLFLPRGFDDFINQCSANTHVFAQAVY